MHERFQSAVRDANFLMPKIMHAAILCVILDCHSLLSHLYSRTVITLICGCCFAALFLMDLKERGRPRFSRSALHIAGLFLAGAVLLMIFSDFLYVSFVSVDMFLFTVFMLYLLSGDILLKRRMVLEAFTNVTLAISLVSLVFFLLGSCAGILKPTASYPHELVQWGNIDYNDYFHLYCDGQATYFLGRWILRNISVFVEAPMYAYVLAVALYMELFLKKSSGVKVLVYLVTIATTLSTTGMILAFVFIAMKAYEKYQHKICNRRIVVPAVLTVVFIGVAALLLEKTAGANLSASSSIRMDDMLASLKAFLHNPVAGLGYVNLRGLDPYRAAWRLSDAGTSTGLGSVLAFGGILWSWIYIAPPAVSAYRVIRYRGREPLYPHIFNLVALILLTVTIVQGRITGVFITAFCWSIVLSLKTAKEHPNG